MIGLHAERLKARERSRIPGGIWGVLYLLAILSLASMGYHCGVAGTTRSPVMLTVAVAFTLVILVILDLDRPGEGFVGVRQQAMIDLRDALKASPP